MSREDAVHSVNPELATDDAQRVQAYRAELVERIGRILPEDGVWSR